MAWYNSGTISGLQVSKLGRILAELCRAVNERRQYLLGSPHTFSLTSSAYPAWSDFSGKRLTESGVSSMMTQMRAILQEITYERASYQDQFINEATGNRFADQAELVAKGGYGSSWLTWLRPQDPLPLMQIRGVIEAVKYLDWEIQGGDLSGTLSGKDVGPAVLDTQDVAWSTMLAGTVYPTYGNILGVLMQKQWEDTSPTDWKWATVSGDYRLECDFTTAWESMTYYGEQVKLFFDYEIENVGSRIGGSPYVSLSEDIEHDPWYLVDDRGGDPFEVYAAPNTTVEGRLFRTPSWWAGGVDKQVMWDWDGGLPTLCPVENIDSLGDPYQIITTRMQLTLRDLHIITRLQIGTDLTYG